MTNPLNKRLEQAAIRVYLRMTEKASAVKPKSKSAQYAPRKKQGQARPESK